MSSKSATQQLLEKNEQIYIQKILKHLSRYKEDREIIAQINPHLEQIAADKKVSIETILAFIINLQGFFNQIEQICIKNEITWEDITEAIEIIKEFKGNNLSGSDDHEVNWQLSRHSYFNPIFDLKGILSQNVGENLLYKRETDAEINYWSKYQSEYRALKTTQEKVAFLAKHKAKISSQQNLAGQIYDLEQYEDLVSDRHLVFDFDGVLGDTFIPYCKVIFLYELNPETKGSFEKCRSVLENPNFEIDENDLLRAKKWIWHYLAKPSHTNLDDLQEQRSIQKLASWGQLMELIGYKYFDAFIKSIYNLRGMGFEVSIVSNTPEKVLEKIIQAHPDLFENALGRESGGSKLAKIQELTDDLSQVIYITDSPADVLELQDHIPIILGVNFGFYKENIELLKKLVPEHQLINGETGLNQFFKEPRESEFRFRGVHDFASKHEWGQKQLEILEFYVESENKELKIQSLPLK